MSFQIASPNTEAAILARLVQVEQEDLPRGALSIFCRFALAVAAPRA